MSYEEVGRMSPDQVYHRLCESDVLKLKRGVRVATAQPASLEADSEGFVRGRSEDGTPIKKKIRVGGKSLAARLNEEAAERERAERKKVKNGN